jgi:dipeptidase D
MSPATDKILDYFYKINAIPRCSNNEAQLSRWLRDWAGQHRFASRTDSAGNLAIIVPPTPGYETSAGVVLQGHMDMVCEKTPDSTHDFSKDPIRSVVDGDWLKAEGTTLGADNGIAIAYALALAEDEHAAHPLVELLFTVDEESGLNGAKMLAIDLIQSKTLINLDSEDEGVFTIGCAGGTDIEITLTMTPTLLPSDWHNLEIRIGGFMGGHSGIDIHKQRGNANKVLARTLTALRRSSRIRLAHIKGGSRHNAIPRDAVAQVACEPSNVAAAEKIIADMQTIVRQEYISVESDPFITVKRLQSGPEAALSPDDSDRVVGILSVLPHGVAGMSTAFADTVETSSNLATVTLDSGTVTILNSQRSACATRLDDINTTVFAAAGLAAAETRKTNSYPPWAPDTHSRLLASSKEVYHRLFDTDPVIQVIHAGLECAIIGNLYNGMDMISFGPTIRNPHSPSECLYIPSLEKVWTFLVALLTSMK